MHKNKFVILPLLSFMLQLLSY